MRGCCRCSSLVTGQWEQATITVYLCGISVVFACLIGMPIGIASTPRPRLWSVVQVVIDTLQTLPSFVYLIPVVMLFRVGDFTAIIAVVAYALAPAIRYTAHGLRSVDPQLIEAGVACGLHAAPAPAHVKLKLALPEILLGLNQTIMLAISMLVITALVGTRDLGQEVYIALAKADTGRGIVAGLAIAFIAIIADRLITAGAERIRARLGLGDGRPWTRAEPRPRPADLVGAGRPAAARRRHHQRELPGRGRRPPRSSSASATTFPIHGVMRFNELAASHAAHAAGVSPAIVHAEPGALVIEYIDGRTLAAGRRP